MPPVHPALADLLAWASATPWVTDVWLAGSLATGDHCPRTSDIDAVALTSGRVGPERREALATLHRSIDAGSGRGARLGCVYVAAELVDEVRGPHPTWTHGRLVERPLSPMARAELLDHGTALLGRLPAHVLAPMTPADVREAVRSELLGYWSWAVGFPWLFLDRRMVDLSLLTMARARHAPCARSAAGAAEPYSSTSPMRRYSAA